MTYSDKLKTRAAKLLSRRNFTVTEFKQKLITAGFEESEVNIITEEYLEIGWLDDSNYLESYLHYQSERGIGPVKIAHDLKKKGIDSKLIAERINISDNTWQDRAHAVWRKKFKAHIPTSPREMQKQIRFLIQRGFTQRHINTIFKSQDNEFNHEQYE